MRTELHRTREEPATAGAIFDGYLCSAEYLLYGPTSHAEVIKLAQDLLDTAEQSGARRAAAFARALSGEAALLSGDLTLAAAELTEASVLHRELGCAAGEAHSLQRLAEARVAQGDTANARRLLEKALPLARDSIVARHLLHRIFGTMIHAAAGAAEARRVDRAESMLGWEDMCQFCSIMLAVPATIACARAGDLAGARATWPPPNAWPWYGRAPRGRRGWPRRRPRSRRPAASPARPGSGCGGRPVGSSRPITSWTPSGAAGPSASWPRPGRAAGGCPRPATVARWSRGRREQLEGDVVGVAERQARTVARVLDLTVGHTQLVQAGGPLHQFGAAGAAERDVVQARRALVELVLSVQVGEPVQPEQRITQLVDDMPERPGVLVQDRLDAEDAGVSGLAGRQVGHGDGDVRDGRNGS